MPFSLNPEAPPGEVGLFLDMDGEGFEAVKRKYVRIEHLLLQTSRWKLEVSAAAGGGRCLLAASCIYLFIHRDAFLPIISQPS